MTSAVTRCGKRVWVYQSGSKAARAHTYTHTHTHSVKAAVRVGCDYRTDVHEPPDLTAYSALMNLFGWICCHHRQHLHWSISVFWELGTLWIFGFHTIIYNHFDWSVMKNLHWKIYVNTEGFSWKPLNGFEFSCQFDVKTETYKCRRLSLYQNKLYVITRLPTNYIITCTWNID